MTIAVRQGLPLVADTQGREIHRAWLDGRVFPGASDSIVEALSYPGSRSGPAPLFRGDWVPQWPLKLAPQTQENLEKLRRGEAETVVTGQQPGRLGGPLYTLYKVATAVELARLMSGSGRPAVPVYWSGDDDDDHDEAMAPACWDPETGTLLDLATGPGRKSRERPDPMVGRLGGAATVEAEADWLGRRARDGDPLVEEWAGVWTRAAEEDWPWSRLQAEAFSSLFHEDGLLVVSGDDPRLHRTAGPFYDRLKDDPGQWPRLVAESGRSLESAGFHAQIGDRSLANPLFVDEDGVRRPVSLDELPRDTQDVRPGVLYRSPLQDWALQPAAVVVGPGELAYLKQLEPLYGALGVPRAPLVPRLSAWLLPAGCPEPGQEPVPDPGRATEWAAEATGAAVESLRRILAEEIGLDGERAADLAVSRGRRFSKGAAAMLRDEALRAGKRYRGSLPGWVHPRDGRQERILAVGCAVGLWGTPLLAAVRKAARQHLLSGREGDWRRFRADVPAPKSKEG